MTSPLVTVVTATYNRGDVLRLSIEALLRSRLDDWELIVVGDACTDHTEAVVASFGDPRMRFINLAENCGEQSGPNNEGARLARGRYLAFLNHDDLWTPDHLTACVAELESSAADLVFSLVLGFDHGTDRPSISGVSDGSYALWNGVVASSCVMRRELFDAVGPWRPARGMFGAPSQEWLARAYRSGHVMRAVPRITVVAVRSGGLPGSYVGAAPAINDEIARRLRDEPDFIEEMAARILLEQERGVAHQAFRVLKLAVKKGLAAAGIAPVAFFSALQFRRRGGLLDALRRTRGLPPLPRPEERNA